MQKKQKVKGLLYGKQLYIVLSSMKSRCLRSSHKQYPKYGGRGITICDEWLNKENGFTNFYNWAMSNGFKPDKKENGYNLYEIDRIDNSLGYCPSNCRWVTRKEQENNKACTLWFTYNGETKPLKYWCEERNLPYLAVYLRIHRRKWPFEKAINTPLKVSNRGRKTNGQ